MNRFRTLFAWGLLALGLLLAGCSLTPHANVGVNFHMSDGKLKATPNANVGVYARP